MALLTFTFVEMIMYCNSSGPRTYHIAKYTDRNTGSHPHPHSCLVIIYLLPRQKVPHDLILSNRDNHGKINFLTAMQEIDKK